MVRGLLGSQNTAPRMYDATPLAVENDRALASAEDDPRRVPNKDEEEQCKERCLRETRRLVAARMAREKPI